MKHILQLTLTLFALVAICTSTFAAVHYVDIDATGSNNGNSWANAYTDLQLAIVEAVNGDEIWVAAGVYKTTSGTDRDISFYITEDLSIYGGFAGTETLRTQRDWNLNQSVLTGAINNPTNPADNSKNIFVIASSTVVLDGLHIRRSYMGAAETGVCGALRIESATVEITRCKIYQNEARSNPALYSNDANIILDNCLIRDNHSLTLDDVYAHIITTMYLTCDLTIRECTIVDNIHEAANPKTINITNPNSQFHMYNSILWNNEGNEILNPAVNSAVSDCLIEGGYAEGTAIIDTDPIFFNPNNDNFALQSTSPARNMGNEAFSFLTEDLAHGTRIFDGAPDLGAFENQDAFVIYVDIDANGANNGTSWTNAFTDLQSALAIAVAGKEIWVAEGTYVPSQTNNRAHKFELIDNYSLYGGFLGNEVVRSQRNLLANPTFLSGEIGDPNVDTDNSYIILYAHIATEIAVDGFRITDCYGVTGQVSNAIRVLEPTQANIGHCVIFNNTSYSSPVLANGSIANMDNCLIYDNHTNSAGIFGFETETATTNLFNCTISENTFVQSYASVFSYYTINGIVPTVNLYNSIVWSHTNSITNNGGNVNAYNSILETVLYFDIVDDSYVIDPQFKNPGANNFALNNGSIGINTGENVHSTESTDVIGNARVQNTTVDIGCFEEATCGQLHDVCENAISLELNSTPIVSSTKCATGDDGGGNACVSVVGKSVWFLFDGPCDGTATITVDYYFNVTTTFNPRITLYGGDCEELSYISCMDANGISLDEVLVANALTPGDTYYIRVDAPSSQEGMFYIDVNGGLLEGDFDSNGSVNVGDLLIFTSQFGCTSNCGAADLDENGAVNVGDLLIFTSVFGTTCE